MGWKLAFHHQFSQICWCCCSCCSLLWVVISPAHAKSNTPWPALHQCTWSWNCCDTDQHNDKNTPSLWPLGLLLNVTWLGLEDFEKKKRFAFLSFSWYVKNNLDVLLKQHFWKWILLNRILLQPVLKEMVSCE